MKSKLLALMLALIMVLSGTAVFAAGASAQAGKGTGFADIRGHWAEKAVNSLAGSGVFQNEAGDKFIPGKAITRKEFAFYLHKALGISINYFKATDIKEFFSDVSNEDWYAGALYDLAVTGIIDCKGQFRPDGTLTREEMVHYIMNAYRYEMGGIAPDTAGLDIKFKDKAKIAPEYLDDMKLAVSLGFVIGRGNGLLGPKDDTRRSEAVMVIYRLVDALNAGKKVDVAPGYEKGTDSFTMKLVIRNGSDRTITINHTSSQKYDFKLLDADRNILYSWSMDKLFMMALASTEIKPGESVEFTEKLDTAAFKDILDKTEYLTAYIAGTSSDFKINPDGYETAVE